MPEHAIEIGQRDAARALIERFAWTIVHLERPYVTLKMAMSLDGYVAGPNQSEKDPLGEGGERVHEWAVKLEAWRASHGHDGGEQEQGERQEPDHGG